MNCQIRVRKYGSGWLAWSVFYAGDRTYLSADKPNLEILTPTMEKTVRLHQSKRDNIKDFMKAVFRDVLAAGEKVYDPLHVEHKGITFTSKRQKISIDRVIVDMMDKNGQWMPPDEYRLLNNGRFYRVTGMIKPGLPESMEADDVG